MQPAKRNGWAAVLWVFAAVIFLCPRAALSQPSPAAPVAADAAWQVKDIRIQAAKRYREGKVADAVGILERALAGIDRSAKPNDIDAAGLLTDLARIALDGGDAKRAETLYSRAVKRIEKKLGRDHVEVSFVLDGLSVAYRALGKIDQAIALGQRLLAIRDKALGADHPDTIEAMRLLAEHYEAKRDYPRVIALYEHVVAIRNKSSTTTPGDHAGAVADLAEATIRSGDAAGGIQIYEALVPVMEKGMGPTHKNLAGLLTRLSDLYRDIGNANRAVVLVERALQIRETTLGPEHLDVATTLNRLAAACRDAGDYDRAAAAAARALALFEKALGPSHLDIAPSLNDLAEIELGRGNYTRAETLFLRCLDLFTKAFGPDHKQVGIVLNNIASVHYAKGDFQAALDFFQRALRIREKVFGPDHSDVAAALGNVAEVYLRLNDAAAAEPLFLRAASIREKALGPDHPLTGLSLHNLGSLYLEKGELAKAEPLLRRALAVREKALGSGHPELAPMLNNLASVHQRSGDFDQAEQLLRRALGIQENALGPDHPAVAVTLHNLATLRQSRGDGGDVLSLYARANDIGERHTALILATGSEAQKLAYLKTLSPLTHSTVSLHVRDLPDNRAAARLALLTILRRKGRALDAVAESIGALRSRLGPEEQGLLDKLAAARSRLAKAVLRGSGPEGPQAHAAAVEALKREAQELERAISTRSAEFRVQSEPVTLENVQAAIPDKAALVEIFAYRPFDPKAPYGQGMGNPHYAAYVLLRSGDPAAVDLGETDPIDAQVKALRAALSDPSRGDATALGRALDESVMRPIRRLTGGASMLALSPDGALNLVPFAALTGESHRYLIQDSLFVYLTSGRDLLRLALGHPSRQGAVIVANPSFDAPAAAAGSDGTAAEQAGAESHAGARTALSRMRFLPLPGTAQEAKALGNVLAQPEVLTQALATKNALSQIHGPKILHIATHGFFLTDQGSSPRSARGLVLDPSPAAVQALAPIENPLLRSGIALAGANAQNKSAGILTALEAAGLDLHDTKLVVLSACETGIGDVKNGDGVYGLRRALVIAGAETQVMSLWKVDDNATRDLMVSYYLDIQAGRGRAEAMRRVQLDLLARKATAHPYYWAAFIVSGNPAPVEERIARAVAPVSPGSRGCACETTRPAGSSTAGALWAGAIALAMRRRRGGRIRRFQGTTAPAENETAHRRVPRPFP